MTQLKLPLTPTPRAAPFEPTQDPCEHGHWWDGKGSERAIIVVADREGRL